MRPNRDGGKWKWLTGESFREVDAFPILGLLDEALQDESLKSFEIEMSGTTWAEPLSILMLAGILARHSNRRSQIEINLGTAQYSSQPHRIFLRFLARQGFLSILAEHATFKWKQQHATISNAVELKAIFFQIAHENHFQNADCIHARLVPVSRFRNNLDAFQAFVEDTIKQAQSNAIDTAFGADPNARDILFQKLRKILYELAWNSVEHAYPEDQNGFIGIYARVRGAKPNELAEAKNWEKLFLFEHQSLPAMTQFFPDKFSDWLEVFICDTGRGLTSNLKEWEHHASNKRTQDIIRRARQSANPLQQLSNQLFSGSFSRHSRASEGRTSVTGLVHLGHILSAGGDYSRLYSQGGTWIGHSHPLAIGAKGAEVIPSKRAENNWAKYPAGTAYSISIQPSEIAKDLLAGYVGEWTTLTKDARDNIILALTNANSDTFSPNRDMLFIDRRMEKNCDLPASLLDELRSIAQAQQTVVVRPPRLASKADVGRWLSMFAGLPRELPKARIRDLILAELTPFQAVIFSNFLKTVSIHPDTALDVYLVTENWRVSCLCAVPNTGGKLAVDFKKAQAFSSSLDVDIFCSANLAVLLRQADSDLFWDTTIDGNPIDNVFLNDKVTWIGSSGEKTQVDRYLDLCHALSEPQRYRACRRALRRCLELFPELTPVPSDDIVASLLSDAMKRTYYGQRDSSAQKLTVGSVALTSGTVRRFNDRKDMNIGGTLFLFHHDDSQSRSSRIGLTALNWSPPNAPQISESTVIWERIPNTPFIAKYGQRSISVARFNFENAKPISYYQRSPAETYGDFDRFSMLKLGHWSYGNHHDLITINLKKAVESSFLEHGPLYEWLHQQFQDLFAVQGSNPPLAHVLVYPSHTVTDALVNWIKRDERFKNCMPPSGVFPIRFLGKRTVSPLLVSPLVEHRIKEVIQQYRGKEWTGVVLDDGAVSGKSLREMTHFLQDLGAKEVNTITLVDRTSLPARDGIMVPFLKKHRRFWRLDIPTLGAKRDCPLCRARRIVETLAARLSRLNQRERLKQWLIFWRAADVSTEWYEGGIRPTFFNKSIKVKFGIPSTPPAKGEEEGDHSLDVNNSTSLSAVFAELTRMTTRADKAYARAITLADEYPLASIELLCSQILLFMDELNYWELRDRFVLLLRFLWKLSAISKVSALAGLCITLIDDDLIEDVWEDGVRNLLANEPLMNIDAILAANIFLSRRQFHKGHAFIPASIQGLHAQDNLILLGYGEDFKNGLSGLLSIVGKRQRPWHDTQLRKGLETISAQSDMALVKRSAQDVLVRIVRVSDILKQHEFRLLVLGAHDNWSISQICEDLQSGINLLESGIRTDHIDEIKTGASKIHEAVYGVKNSITGFVETSLSFLPTVGSYMSALLDKARAAAKKSWSDLVRATMPPQATACWWQISDEAISKWECATPLIKWDSDQPIYFDDLIENALRDVLLNVLHATDTIECPWAGQNFGVKCAYMWWRIATGNTKIGQFIEVEFANKVDVSVVSLNYTTALAGLESVGGDFSTKVENEIAYTMLRIPFLSNFYDTNVRALP